MGDDLPRLGVLAGRRLAPNFHAFLGNLGEILNGTFHCDLLLADRNPPARIRAHFRILPYRAPGPAILEPLAGILACRAYCRRERPDLLMNACQPQTLGLAVALAGRMAGVPTIVRMTGNSYEQVALAAGPVAKAKAWLIHEVLADAAYRWGDRVVSIGERSLSMLLARTGRAPGSVAVLPQPIDVRAFRPASAAERAAAKRRLGLAADRRTVLYVGRLTFLKGADRLLAAARLVGAAGGAVQFCIVGEGPFVAEFAALGPELVHLAGPVPHADVPAYYQAADAVVFPSRTEGGVPNVVFEALAARVPVIAAPTGDVAHLVSRIARGPEDMARLIQAGDWRPDPMPEDLAWDRQVARYRAFFLAAAGRAGACGLVDADRSAKRAASRPGDETTDAG